MLLHHALVIVPRHCKWGCIWYKIIPWLFFCFCFCSVFFFFFFFNVLLIFHYKYHFWIYNAGFRLTCRLPLCRYAAWSSLAVSELQLSVATPLWLYHRAASLPSWIEFNSLRSAAVGKAARLSIYNWLDAACRCLPLLAAWSSLCGKWRLRSWTNIIIKAAMRQAAS